MSTAASDLPGVSGETETTPLRFVTAASLFDGHDAAINIMRRLIQAQGAEVIHLGHNRSVDDIVRAAIQEDADGIAVSSYQGGHIEFFRYMIDRLAELGAPHIRVFGGGGGTITPEEIEALMEYGVERIYHPHDGMAMGLLEMIQDLVARTASSRRQTIAPAKVSPDRATDIAATMSAIEEEQFDEAKLASLRKEWQVQAGQVPVVGITGTGGAGKSSVTDEILNRFLACDRRVDGYIFCGRIKLHVVTLPLLADVSQRVLGAALVVLVQYDEVGKIEHVDFLELAGSAVFTRHDIDGVIHHVDDFAVALADAGGFHENQVEA